LSASEQAKNGEGQKIQMTTEEFENRIALAKELLASAGAKLDEAASVLAAVDEKLDRLEAKLYRDDRAVGFSDEKNGGCGESNGGILHF